MADLTAILARDARLTRALKRFLVAIDSEVADGEAKERAFLSARHAIHLAMANQPATVNHDGKSETTGSDRPDEAA